LCDQLFRSTRPGVWRLLLSMLDDPHAPLSALRIIGRRRDVGFFRQLCKKLGEDRSPHLEANVARIDMLAWLDDDELSILTSLSEAEQPGAVLLASRARVAPSEKLRVLEQLLATGSPLGRQAAARAMFETYEGQCDWLVLDLIDDPCPLVQAEAVKRLRECDVPDAVATLIKLLDSPHAEVQAAARHSLDEFSLPRYLASFDTLSEEARYTSGEVVKRVHPMVAFELLSEMTAPGRTRRLRALQATAVLDLAPELASGLCELCSDEHHAVRLEAARLLGMCPGSESRRTLRELLCDPVVAIRQAAEESLQQLAATDPTASTIRNVEARR
jgi:HEAT repeat protein